MHFLSSSSSLRNALSQQYYAVQYAQCDTSTCSQEEGLRGSKPVTTHLLLTTMALIDTSCLVIGT